MTLASIGLAAGHSGTTRDRPPPAHTGAFGEPSCAACHNDYEANHGTGQVRLSGLPDAWKPGHTYDLVLEVADTGMRAAGFQLSARFQDGRPAGRLAPAPEEQGRVDVDSAGAIPYAHHLYNGTDLASPGSARWLIRWTAPDAADPGTGDAKAAIVLNLAVVSADNDLSPLGDLVYTAAWTVPAR